jgi:hypothetical protein
MRKLIVVVFAVFGAGCSVSVDSRDSGQGVGKEFKIVAGSGVVSKYHDDEAKVTCWYHDGFSCLPDKSFK